MRWIKSNGRRLECRKVHEVEYALEPKEERYPLPIVDEVLSDEDARSRLKTLLDTKLYRRAPDRTSRA